MKAGEYPKLKLKQFAKVQDRETSEAKYWKSFTNAKEQKFQSAPSCIHFNPVNPNEYIVTGSTKISLYDATTSDKLQRSYSRFSEDAYSGKFRKDGKLIVAGDKTGYVKVFDVQSKAVLRQMKRHTAAVRSTVWSCDGQRIISGSDDKKVLRWDLATEEVLWTSKNYHTDYVRTVDANPVSSEMFASASYDHTVKIWDARQEEPLQSMEHGQPIEHCMFTPSGTMLLTAGGNEIKVWDILGGGRLMHTFNNHQKNITCLTMDGTHSRVLSAGLDGHVKIYSLETMQVVHGMKFGSPLVSVSMSQDNKKLVVGFVDGNLMVRTRRPEPAHHAAGLMSSVAPLALEASAALSEGHSTLLRQNRFHKGAGLVHEFVTDVGTVETERADRLQPYEKLLKKFSYQKALDAALKTHNPLVVVTVLEELCRRSGLTIALSGRDETTLEPLIAFAARYVNHPKYSKLIIQVAHKVLDLYAGVLGHSDAIDELFLKLQKHVKAEVSFHRQIMRVMGSLDGIISAATMPRQIENDVIESEMLDIDLNTL